MKIRVFALLVVTHCVVGVAGVAKLADAPDLGSGAARRGGSSPFTRTNKKGTEKSDPFFYAVQQAAYLALCHLDSVGLVVNFYLVRPTLYNFGGFKTGCLDTQIRGYASEECTLRVISEFCTLVPSSRRPQLALCDCNAP